MTHTHTHTHPNTSLRPKKWPFYREHPKLVLRRASIVEVNTLTRYIEIEVYSEAAYTVWAKNGFHLHVLSQHKSGINYKNKQT